MKTEGSAVMRFRLKNRLISYRFRAGKRPSAFQLETADFETPKSAAALVVPPRAAMMRAMWSMPGILVQLK